MRTIDQIIIHCSASQAGHDFKATDIDRWHRQRGWRCIGYHYIIRLDGTIEPGRPENMIGAHCAGHNSRSIGICYIGGLDSSMKPCDTRTPAQRKALQTLVKALIHKYPRATVHGHNEFAPKACPCFNVSREFQTRDAIDQSA